MQPGRALLKSIPPNPDHWGPLFLILLILLPLSSLGAITSPASGCTYLHLGFQRHLRPSLHSLLILMIFVSQIEGSCEKSQSFFFLQSFSVRKKAHSFVNFLVCILCGTGLLQTGNCSLFSLCLILICSLRELRLKKRLLQRGQVAASACTCCRCQSQALSTFE